MRICFPNDKKQKIERNCVPTYSLSELEQIFPPEQNYLKSREAVEEAEEFIKNGKKALEYLTDRIKGFENQIASLKQYSKDNEQSGDSVEVSCILHDYGRKNLFFVQDGRNISHWRYASKEEALECHTRFIESRLQTALEKKEEQKQMVQAAQNFLKVKRSIDNSQIKYYIQKVPVDYITGNLDISHMNWNSNSPNSSGIDVISLPTTPDRDLAGEVWDGANNITTETN